MKVVDVFTDADGVNIKLQAVNKAETALLRLAEDYYGHTTAFDQDEGTLIAILPVGEHKPED